MEEISQFLGEIGHLGVRVDILVVNPMDDLPGPVILFAELSHESFQFISIQILDVNSFIHQSAIPCGNGAPRIYPPRCQVVNMERSLEFPQFCGRSCP